MTRRRPLAVLAPLVGLLLVGCGVTPPVGTATSAAPSPTLSSATPTPTPTPSVSSATPTPTPTADASVELRGDGLGTLAFGARQVDVTDLLTERLGEPDESSQGILCELDDSSPWAQTVIYGGLWVQYAAKDQKKKSPRTLSAWGFTLEEEFAAPLKMQDAVPLDLGFDELKQKYPKGKLETLNLGEGDGSRMFTLPNKIRFIGVDKPDMVSAGQFNTCE